MRYACIRRFAASPVSPSNSASLIDGWFKAIYFGDNDTGHEKRLQPLLPGSLHPDACSGSAPIFDSMITACVRLSTPSFCRIAETCALMVASETSSS